ncbi:hypothetical protein BZA05DRAFT_433700 [Tricharina praecox]|uniref:uncharacterized protein n=1 Tax=Tricharina praecox TaxID=43433 RepID=UPI00221E8774|nr:uncharacterized protein BZA05DRAFT_433700 [Tricharina praecox]KAI5857032.1 hypothetical protein BZA05DRAFT_433700 [Tricharina praecox]
MFVLESCDGWLVMVWYQWYCPFATLVCFVLDPPETPNPPHGPPTDHPGPPTGPDVGRRGEARRGEARWGAKQSIICHASFRGSGIGSAARTVPYHSELAAANISIVQRAWRRSSSQPSATWRGIRLNDNETAVITSIATYTPSPKVGNPHDGNIFSEKWVEDALSIERQHVDPPIAAHWATADTREGTAHGRTRHSVKSTKRIGTRCGGAVRGLDEEPTVLRRTDGHPGAEFCAAPSPTYMIHPYPWNKLRQA